VRRRQGSREDRGFELHHQLVSRTRMHVLDVPSLGILTMAIYLLVLLAAQLTRPASDTRRRSPWARWSRSSWQPWPPGTLKVGSSLELITQVACVFGKQQVST
jgi:hypothetical protein